jgi:methylglutaconyl-CoA hydratase
MNDDLTRLRLEGTGPVRRVVLARPEVHNAFDDVLIRELTQTFEAVAHDETVRVVVLTGEGRSFCAGADLNWMSRMADYGREENLADARALAHMLVTVDGCPKATVARVNGAAFGGACGLIACCDVAVAVDTAKLALSEVKLGIVPATISPFVHARIGTAQARRYFLTGERMAAVEALRIGLVHEVCLADELDPTVDRIVAQLLSSGPRAVATAKTLIQELGARSHPEVHDYTARLIADVRSTDEAREGMGAFLEKRPPGWIKPV